jgi:hypothetical protein
MPKNLRMRLRLRAVPGWIYSAAEGVSMKGFCGEAYPKDPAKHCQQEKEG